MTARRHIADADAIGMLGTGFIFDVPDAPLPEFRGLRISFIVRRRNLATRLILEIGVDDLLNRLLEQIDHDGRPVFAAGMDVVRVPLIAGAKPHPLIELFAQFAVGFGAIMPVPARLLRYAEVAIVAYVIRHLLLNA